MINFNVFDRLLIIMTQNTNQSNMCLAIILQVRRLGWGGSKRRKQQKGIERRACS